MSGLILTRRRGETIKIGANVTVTVLGYRGNQVRLIIDAPKDLAVDRGEVREQKELQKGFQAGEVT